MSNRDCILMTIALNVFTAFYCVSVSPALAAINFAVAIWNYHRIS
jgi:hypothetical protein